MVKVTNKKHFILRFGPSCFSPIDPIDPIIVLVFCRKCAVSTMCVARRNNNSAVHIIL